MPHPMIVNYLDDLLRVIDLSIQARKITEELKWQYASTNWIAGRDRWSDAFLHGIGLRIGPRLREREFLDQ